MQDQTQRDEKTVDIFTGLLLFIGVVVLGGASLVLVQVTVGLDDQVVKALLWGITAAGAALTVRYLARRK